MEIEGVMQHDGRHDDQEDEKLPQTNTNGNGNGNGNVEEPKQHMDHTTTRDTNDDDINTADLDQHLPDHDTPARDSDSPAVTVAAAPVDASDRPSTPPPGSNKKKRKLADLQSGSRARSESRPVSPPWKPFAADGPTQFLDNGKRRSGRVNAPPSATPPRPTKKAAPKSAANKGSALKNAQILQQQPTPVKPKETHPPAPPKPPKTPPRPSRISARIKNQETTPPPPPPPQSVKQEDVIAASSVSPQSKRKASRSSKPSQSEIEQQDDKPATESKAAASPGKSRITLKLKRPPFSFSARHPSHVVQPLRFQSLDQIIDHYDQKLKDAALRNTDDDRYEGLERRLPERAEQAPEERAEKEARTRLRILEAARPGGPLSEEKSSVYLPDDQKQLPPQYNHYDHLWAHGAYLKALLDREKRSHIETAKRIAHACLAKWRERQPQTDEEKEKQENEWFKLIYRQTVKDVQRKWELVGAEIDRRRATRYEEEQRIERELKMQDMLEKSTNLLDKRRAMLDSEMSADEELDSMSDGASDDDNGSKSSHRSDEDHHMTSSESEGDDEVENDPDTNLSPEALRRKYSTIPDLPQEDSEDDASEMDVDADHQDEAAASDVPDEDQDPESEATGPTQEERDYSKVQLEEVDDALLDDSDESTDMSDDDMSSEEEEDDEDNENEEEESEEEDAGLLGFFGGRKALAKESESVEQVDEPEDSAQATQRRDEKVEDQEDSARDVDAKAVEETVKHDMAEETAQVTDQDSDSKAGAEDGLVSEAADAMDVDDTPKAARNVDRDHPHVDRSGESKSQHPPELSVNMEVDESTPNGLRMRSVSADHNMLSADSHGEDRSSQMSPKDDTTVEPTEAESTTSIDLDDATHITRSNEDTPQPKTTKVKIPSLLRGTLREYQHEGLDWLAKLYANQTNGILADEMGLGKTIQTIALLAHLAEEHHIWGPHLIVVPTSVILNWEMEFKKFLPGFKVLSYYGSVEERAQKRKGWSNPDNWNVVITSYQLILKDLSAIRVPEWHYMILDEAHNIKNFNSQRYQAMIRLKTHARLLLTGTPLQNSIVELWSLLTFLTAGQDGQGMGDLEEFTEWFRRPVDEIFVDGKSKLGNEAQDIVSKLHHSLRPYLLRRLKAHVEKQLPGKYEHTVICRLSKRQRQLYDAFMGLSDTKAKLSSGNMISVSQALMSLRKVCNHPDLFEERPIVTSFAMTKPFSRTRQSVVANFEITDLLLRRKMLAKDPTEHLDLDFLSLNLVSRESGSGYHVKRSRQLRASDVMNELVQAQTEKLSTEAFDGSSFASVLDHQKRVASFDRLNKLRRCAMLTEQRTNFAPVFGTDLIERCTTYTSDRLHRTPPRDMARHAEWYLDTSSILHGMVKTVDARSAIMDPLIRKFSCITPNAVADVLTYMAPAGAINTVQSLSSSSEPDAFHEPRIRLSIAFPDKRLLQYDCGKLQRLATLLRELQSRGSRALIFTQMTSVLDILERFLNIHGYRYLRLDGSTKIEQRQDMMERFNRDTRIDVFILSSRSGGVGMNLTGADAVVFYDLDWNPQMDKQCQDRAHRIGQTRDVHIYKFVSEHTIEVNILRKSNQKRLLDEVVIQEGEFTTDYFNTSATATADEDLGDEFAGAAVERVFGANVGEANVTKVLEAVEDAEDVAAAHAQQKDLQADDFDFDAPPGANNTQDTSRTSRTPKTSVPATPGVVDSEDVEAKEGDGDADEEGIKHVDDYMLAFLDWWFKDVKYVPPPDKSRRGRLDRNGRDRSHRPRNR